MLMLMFSACPADRRRCAVDASLGPDLRALAPEHPCRRLPGTLGLAFIASLRSPFLRERLSLRIKKLD